MRAGRTHVRLYDCGATVIEQREFAWALRAMVAERVRPQGRTVLLRIFMKAADYRDQREYGFAVWEGEPGRERVDLMVSPVLFDAMQRPPTEPERAGFVPPGVGESAAVEEVEHPGSSGVRVARRDAVSHPPSEYRADALLRRGPARRSARDGRSPCRRRGAAAGGRPVGRRIGPGQLGTRSPLCGCSAGPTVTSHVICRMFHGSLLVVQ